MHLCQAQSCKLSQLCPGTKGGECLRDGELSNNTTGQLHSTCIDARWQAFPETCHKPASNIGSRRKGSAPPNFMFEAELTHNNYSECTSSENARSKCASKATKSGKLNELGLCC
eukprot:910671-Amphidinium_carterae.1